MNLSLKTLVMASCACMVMPHASASSTTLSDCTVTSRSEAVVLMLCKANMDDKVRVEAAKANCTPGKSCNVWIWEDATKMPVTAPKIDADLPKTATGAAVAVWVNDSGSLMKLKKVK